MAYDCFIDIIHLHCVLIYKHLYFVCSLDLECSFNRYSQGSRAYCRWACLLGCWLNCVKETFLQYRGITYFFVNQKGCTCNKLAWGISYTSCSKDCNLFSLNNFHEQEKLKSIFSVSMISSVKGDVIKIKWLLENLWLIIFTFKYVFKENFLRKRGKDIIHWISICSFLLLTFIFYLSIKKFWLFWLRKH